MKITILPKRKGVLALELALFAGLIVFVTQPFVQPVKSSPPAADPARLERDVRKLSVDFFPRHYQSPSLEKTARYIEERLTAMGGRVSSQPFTVEGKPFRNVVARYGPENGSVLVIT